MGVKIMIEFNVETGAVEGVYDEEGRGAKKIRKASPITGLIDVSNLTLILTKSLTKSESTCKKWIWIWVIDHWEKVCAQYGC